MLKHTINCYSIDLILTKTNFTCHLPIPCYSAEENDITAQTSCTLNYYPLVIKQLAHNKSRKFKFVHKYYYDCLAVFLL